MDKSNVCVVGAGIIGLSSAVRVQESGPSVRVTVIADKFSPSTTGDGSPGTWKPHLLNEDQADLIREWSEETFEHLLTLQRSPLAGKLGVQLLSGYNFSQAAQNPSWKTKVFGFRNIRDDELKICPDLKYENTKRGVFYTTLSIDVKSYLSWLQERFVANGGLLEERKINQLEQLFYDYDVIVNCTGIGSHDLVGDRELTPVRGQLMKVEAPWIKYFIIRQDPKDDTNEVFIFPGRDVVTLGGTAQVGNWNPDIDPVDAESIWKNCLALMPSLKDAKVLNNWVGFRPKRTHVRLEMETRQTDGRNKMIVHNYGHSGSGVTLHWGCAGHAAILVREAVHFMESKSKL
ncbi:hypothetical protein FSP39_000502 [Pinctada imbricata]|uniref:FAD dependent oxidoreductase domain-containing protein n=1 Tax=Pinctada imbricata TaxID=66713 RepID=A0AA88XP42_PINIB|nr:hypothetical protein FSP39_000502 [Pinctada imbricata]